MLRLSFYQGSVQMQRKSKIDSSNDEGITLPSVKGDIEFQHVSFKYPTRPDVQILTDLCLNIHSGKIDGRFGVGCKLAKCVVFFLVYLYMYIGHIYGTVSLLIVIFI